MQESREQSLLGFREGEYNVLIATDVAGRGIDVPDVALVINYDMPTALDLYTHRIGRTARAGKSGTAVTFLSPQVCAPSTLLLHPLSCQSNDIMRLCMLEAVVSFTRQS